jgi:hypothetical protein
LVGSPTKEAISFTISSSFAKLGIPYLHPCGLQHRGGCRINIGFDNFYPKAIES